MRFITQFQCSVATENSPWRNKSVKSRMDIGSGHTSPGICRYVRHTSVSGHGLLIFICSACFPSEPRNHVPAPATFPLSNLFLPRADTLPPTLVRDKSHRDIHSRFKLNHFPSKWRTRTSVAETFLNRRIDAGTKVDILGRYLQLRNWTYDKKFHR